MLNGYGGFSYARRVVVWKNIIYLLFCLSALFIFQNAKADLLSFTVSPGFNSTSHTSPVGSWSGTIEVNNLNDQVNSSNVKIAVGSYSFFATAGYWGPLVFWDGSGTVLDLGSPLLYEILFDSSSQNYRPATTWSDLIQRGAFTDLSGAELYNSSSRDIYYTKSGGANDVQVVFSVAVEPPTITSAT